MLKRFEVTNFKNFKEKFVFDLSDTKNYSFNEECVENGIVKTGLIYGANGCGKSNLGNAILDIKNHLSDVKTDLLYKNDYLNAGCISKLAEFKYIFQFRKSTIEYSYGKRTADSIVYEEMLIDGKKVLALDRRESQVAFIDLEGAETLNRDFSTSDISLVKYVKNNAVLTGDQTQRVFKRFTSTIENLLHLIPVEYFSNISSNHHMAGLVKLISPYFSDFQDFLKDAGISDNIALTNINGEERIVFDFESNHIDFASNASSGTLVLTNLFSWLCYLKKQRELSKIASNDYAELKSITEPFIFIDEFDAFYHHAVSKIIVKIFKEEKSQVLFTTHNTSIMTNDLLRPDCNFLMQNGGIKPLHAYTEKDLRKAHNIEKLYRGGTFNE